MSSFDYTFITDFSLENCQELLQHMMNNSDWKITKTDDCHYTLKEPKGLVGVLTSNAYPIQINVAIQAEQGGTCFLVHGSNIGIGPIQSKAVKEKVNDYISTIQEMIGEAQKIIRREQNIRIETQNQINAGVLCPTCGNRISPGTRFCPHDGTPISRQCKKCGFSNMPGAQFCSNCGDPIQ